MHIPDGFINVATAAATYVGSGAAVAYAVKKTNQELGEKEVPFLGVMAAFIFAAQMLNFPVAGGTSGHLLGGALAAILLGPWSAMLALTAVLVVQALAFQDGGIIALGANVFNMAVVGVLVGYFTYVWVRRLFREGNTATFAGAIVASWLSVVVASGFAAVELAISGTSPLGVALPAMLTVHALIGIGEAIITVAVLSFLTATRPDLLQLHAKKTEV